MAPPKGGDPRTIARAARRVTTTKNVPEANTQEALTLLERALEPFEQWTLLSGQNPELRMLLTGGSA